MPCSCHELQSAIREFVRHCCIDLILVIAQDEGSGRYGLGPLTLQLGLISPQQFDPVRLATPLLRELAQSLGLTMEKEPVASCRTQELPHRGLESPGHFRPAQVR